jgi:lysophospholipase L1-like esterase
LYTNEKQWTVAMLPTIRPRARLALVALVAVCLAAWTGFAGPKDGDRGWVATWGASPVAPLPANTTNTGFTNQTVRLIVHTSLGGNEVRVRLSNAFGTESLVIGAAHLGLRSMNAVTVSGTDRPLTFNGSSSVTIPPGALVVSDGVKLDVPPLSDLAISLYLPGPTGQATWHATALSTNYVSRPGDFTAAADFPVDHTVTSWFYLTDVEVKSSRDTFALVTFGDSITDGTRSTPDTNHRWPNLLAERLTQHHVKLSVVDEGIAGNRVLHDFVGPNALARFDRDVLTQPGVAYVTVLLGINDIGDIGRVLTQPGLAPQPVSADEIIAGHLQMIARAHQQGLKILGCTLTPFEGAAYFSPEGETKREAVNKFIRMGGAYDGVIDFDAVVRDPGHTARFLAMYDSGDHLHPNDAGYKAMADAIDLSLFKKR